MTIGGVPSNFRMPDVLCVGLGAGSYVHSSDLIGPVSIGRDQVRQEEREGGEKELTLSSLRKKAFVLEVKFSQ